MRKAGALPFSRAVREGGAFRGRAPFFHCHPEAAQAFAKRRPANEGSLHFHLGHRRGNMLPTKAAVEIESR